MSLARQVQVGDRIFPASEAVARRFDFSLAGGEVVTEIGSVGRWVRVRGSDQAYSIEVFRFNDGTPLDVSDSSVPRTKATPFADLDPPTGDDETVRSAVRELLARLGPPHVYPAEDGHREASFYRMPVTAQCIYCNRPVRLTLDGNQCEMGHRAD